MSYVLRKTFRFESAHRLAKNYQGKCSNIHGHSWNGSIAVRCEKLDDRDMALDYGEMKIFVKKLEDYLDHTLWLFEGDKGLIESLKDSGLQIRQFPTNPTSEALARYLYSELEMFLESYPGAYPEEVVVEETCTTSCTFSLKK